MSKIDDYVRRRRFRKAVEEVASHRHNNPGGFARVRVTLHEWSNTGPDIKGAIEHALLLMLDDAIRRAVDDAKRLERVALHEARAEAEQILAETDDDSLEGASV